MAGREVVTHTATCPKCGRTGEVEIEEDTGPYGRGSDLKSVSKGFRHSPEHDRGSHFGISCTKCGVKARY